MQTKAIRLSPVVRSVGVISAVAVLVGGVTFAALQSQATLTDNTISSASAGLLVDGNADGQFSEKEPGFAFEGIVPGVTPSETKTFSLQNSGETDMKVKAAVRYNGTETPEMPEIQSLNGEHHNIDDPTLPELPEGVDAHDIVFTFTEEGGTPVNVTWEKLSTKKGKKIVKNLAAGATSKLTVQVSIDESVDASAIDIGSFDIVFTGKAVAAAEVPEEEPEEETPAPEEEAPAPEDEAPAPEDEAPVEEQPEEVPAQ